MAAAENSALTLRDCSISGDRYQVQMRYAGELHWLNSTIYSMPLPAADASALVRDLNVSAVERGDVVYRSVLVEVPRG